MRKISSADAIANLTILFLLVGHPKIPFLGLPAALIALMLYYRKLVPTFRSPIFIPQMAVILIFGIYCGVRAWLEPSSTLQDLTFIATLLYKALTAIFIAQAFFALLENNYKLIYLYLAIQLSLIAISAFSIEIYEFLLLFQTEAARSVFVETFGLRSMGFGVIHNEGVAFLVLMYAFVLLKDNSSIIGLFMAPLMYVSALTSRMSLILIAMSQAMLSPVKLIISIVVICATVIFLFDTSSGPLSEVFELYNNFIATGELQSRSTSVMSEMPFVPDNFITWMVGDGKFIADDGFYMETDLGFSRVLFFGGIFGLLLYVLVSVWPLFIIDYRNKNIYFYLFLFNLLAYFVIINIKGINIQNWALITLWLV
ncbi:MAG: hypothetical protein HOO97_05750 [Sideroxydans sp.]|nr:hypothetical protein [Sideroxydans sp.]